MIQDIAPKQLDITHRSLQPGPQDRVFCFYGREVLLTDDGEIPQYAAFPAEVSCRYLFAVDDTRYFLLQPETRIEPEGMVWQKQHRLRTLQPMDRTLAAFTAQHLDHWYRSNRFCGRCGGRMVDGTDERKLVCPDCGNQIYPRINPAVIAAVTDGDRLLMTRYAAGPVRRYVLVAGFVEIGETAEQTVAREVLEETGVHVKNVRYFGSQPWGCAGNLTLGYWAELDGADAVHADGVELSDACWFSRSEVPVPDDDTSVTSAMIRAFAQGKEWGQA